MNHSFPQHSTQPTFYDQEDIQKIYSLQQNTIQLFDSLVNLQNTMTPCHNLTQKQDRQKKTIAQKSSSNLQSFHQEEQGLEQANDLDCDFTDNLKWKKSSIQEINEGLLQSTLSHHYFKQDSYSIFGGIQKETKDKQEIVHPCRCKKGRCRTKHCKCVKQGRKCVNCLCVCCSNNLEIMLFETFKDFIIKTQVNLQ